MDVTGTVAAPTVPLADWSASAATKAADDLTDSPEVQAALTSLEDMAKQAAEIARDAADNGSENPQSDDVRRAEQVRDDALKGKEELRRVARHGNPAAVTAVIARLLASTRTSVDNVEAVAEANEHAGSGVKVRRIGSEAAEAKKQQQKNSLAISAFSPVGERSTRERAAAAVHMLADGDDEDGIDLDRVSVRQLKEAAAERVGVSAEKRRRNAHKETYGVSSGGVTSGVKQQSRKLIIGAESAATTIAHEAGLISDKKADTADDLFTRASGARNDKEFEYEATQISKAIDRNVWGRTFIGQEIEDALPSLGKTKAAKAIVDNKYFGSLRGLSVSDVTQRLREQGYIKGEKGWAWQDEKNQAWSDAAIKRIDRNGDGQLSAAEIAYAMTHQYGVKQAPKAEPKTAAPIKVTQAQINAARDRIDLNDDGIVTKGEINAALKEAGRSLGQMDKDKSGALSNGELVGLSNLLPRSYGAAPAKGK